MVHLTFKWMKILATQLEHVDTWCGGQENSEEREQAGALVATRCTVSTVRDC